MEEEEKIQAHVLSVWKESRGFFTGKGKEGMLILTNKCLYFISCVPVYPSVGETPARAQNQLKTRTQSFRPMP